jgi:hypothetical protein
MYLLDLPPELLIRVLAVATAIHPIPAHVLVLNKFIYGIAAAILYRTPLLFLHLCAWRASHPVIWGSDTVGKPSTITVDLAGSRRRQGGLSVACGVSSRRLDSRGMSTNLTTRLELEDLRLCLHSTNDADAADQSLQSLGLCRVSSSYYKRRASDHTGTTTVYMY